jgi:predicted  nucleic acid-binding Zn-ribbon protein
VTTIEKLLVLQDRDRRIKQLMKEMEEAPARKKLFETTLNQHKAAVAEAHDRLKKNAAAIKALELEIESLRGRVAKLRLQQNDVRTNEEYRALEREIAATEKAIRAEEDKEIALMEEAEGLRANVALMEHNLREEQKAVDANNAALEGRLDSIRAEIQALSAERSKLALEIDEAWMARYDRIFKHTGDFAVVPIENGSCGGCHMVLPPHLVHEAKRNDTMTACTYCGRLLYWRVGVGYY